MSDRLEAATKIYSSNILMSGQFYDLLSDHIKVYRRDLAEIAPRAGRSTAAHLGRASRLYLGDISQVGIRLVDHITLKGGHKPFRVYACDRSNLWLKINPRLVEIYGAEAAYEQARSAETRRDPPRSAAETTLRSLARAAL